LRRRANTGLTAFLICLREDELPERGGLLCSLEDEKREALAEAGRRGAQGRFEQPVGGPLG